MPPQRAEEGDAVHLRHIDVDDQRICRADEQPFKPFNAIKRLFDLEARLLQDLSIVEPDEVGVVDDQDAHLPVSHARASGGLR